MNSIAQEILAVFGLVWAAGRLVRGLRWVFFDPNVKPPAAPAAAPVFFEPGDCAPLPEHPWGWTYEKAAGAGGWFGCPVCTARQKEKQTPPYCADRGGHFHFKCDQCGYEWAMETVLRTTQARKKAQSEPPPADGAHPSAGDLSGEKEVTFAASRLSLGVCGACSHTKEAHDRPGGCACSCNGFVLPAGGIP